ncbi:hypothetical protein HJC23_005862 [Cyclotella cryptica]|uniref:Uncharacterized protein n=1 Tax=Cyclotella cryptica TaxID=29204 RepID=A0ABD3QZE1_9STRA|eukprot:CCRYP_000390-RA/>CCRYP_000390-RA protein AED:0.12 eAED:0.12 QI:0/-1/0/1/-1/1/1/0/633
MLSDTSKRKLLLVMTMASLSPTMGSTLLRGADLDQSSHHPTRRHLPQNEGILNLKRINDERKRKNEQRQDDQWKSLSKEEKKKLLAELKIEEEAQQQKSTGNLNEKVQNGRVNGNQLAYLQQYFHQIDGDLEMQSSQLDDVDEDVTWQDLTKEEKKRVIAMMNEELKFHNEVGDKLTKQEKKDKMKEGLMQGSSQFVNGDSGEDNHNDSETAVGADEFVNNNSKPGKLTVDEVMNNNSENDGKENEEGMTQNSNQATNNNNLANGFLNPMPQLTFNDNGSANDAFVSSNSNVPNDAPIAYGKCKGCYSFAKTLTDPSIQLDAFDPTSDLQWSMSGLGWSIVESSSVSGDCYEGESCIASGIRSHATDSVTLGEPTYSNLTLTTDDEFEGGVLTFQVSVQDGLPMPNEAFFVTVDDKLRLAPISVDGDKWVEYSVPVGVGKHTVTWSHAYNPLGLEALPPRKGKMGLQMDDLRLSPFQRMANQGFEDDNAKELLMTSDGDAVWRLDDGASNSGSYSILASSSDISRGSGSSDVHFVLYSEDGGTLKYKISTSTTAPRDDFAILLNDQLKEAVFGLMPTFEYKSLDIPMGKVAVTFRHRKNPGNLSAELLGALGKVMTEGFTRLDDVRFEPNNKR